MLNTRAREDLLAVLLAAYREMNDDRSNTDDTVVDLTVRTTLGHLRTLQRFAGRGG